VDVAAFASLDPDAQLAQRALLHPALRVAALRQRPSTRSGATTCRIRAAGSPRCRRITACRWTEAARQSSSSGRPCRSRSASCPTQKRRGWQALAAGATLGDAIDQALAVDSRFDLGAALTTALRRHRIIDLQPA
jgi:hypothetical protein